jgi:hypothetical protein
MATVRVWIETLRWIRQQRGKLSHHLSGSRAADRWPPASVDIAALSTELSRLRAAMREEPESPSRDIAIGNIAAAEQAARGGDKQLTSAYLKTAGRWSLDIAEKIGVGLVVVAIKAALGI